MSQRTTRKEPTALRQALLTRLGRFPVQPLTVVDNSDISPTGLIFPHDGPYATFSEGKGPSSSFQAMRMLYERPCVSARVLAHLLSGTAVCPVLAPSWPCPVESSQGAHCAPTSAQASLSTRLSRLSSHLHCLISWRASVSSCAPLARGEKPAGSSQAHPYRRLRLSQPAVQILWQH